MEDKLWEIGDVFAATDPIYTGVLWEVVSDDEWVRVTGPGTGRRVPNARLHFARWQKILGMYLLKSAAQIRQEAMAQQISADHSEYYNAITGVEP